MIHERKRRGENENEEDNKKNKGRREDWRKKDNTDFAGRDRVGERRGGRNLAGIQYSL